MLVTNFHPHMHTYTNTWTTINDRSNVCWFVFVFKRNFISFLLLQHFTISTFLLYYTLYDTYNTILKICGSLLLCYFTLNVYLCNNVLEEENNATPCPRSSSKVIKDTSESDVRDIGSKGCLPFFGAKALKATLAAHACILISLMHLCYNIRYCNPIQRACPVINSGTFDIQSEFMYYQDLFHLDSK